MVVGRTLQAGGCAACRISLLRTFTAAPATTFRAQQASRQRLTSGSTQQQIRRSTHQTSDQNLEADGKAAEGEEKVQYAALKPTEEVPAAAQPQADAVPWYLQVDAPKTETKPLSERQKIPELPENPPALLQPLLQQISVDLGLDDLTLLDLRKLDPPPALGANLLMVIGTTRSERHLHVSADRLCRWLRTEYHLRPDADGLIGRNELKLKLKRKAKRARLMGSANDEAYDDGVRTGWVCVDVGVVEGVAGSETIPEREDFVGFGRQTDGVRIVVQMMTEEKRAEVDLEKLWGGVLERGGKMDIEEDFSEARVGVADSLRPTAALPKVKVSPGSWQKEQSPILSQTRRFHSSARRSSSRLEETLASVQAFDVYHDYGVDGLEGIQAHVQAHLSSAEFEKAKDFLLDSAQQQPLLQGEEWRRFLLHNLRVYLEDLPKDQALQELGEGAHDRDSTSFLKTFYDTVTTFPNQAQAEARIWLCCWANSQQHPGYEKPDLYKLVSELQQIGVPISTTSYLNILDRILYKHVSHNHFGAPARDVKFASKIIQIMGDQGLPIISQEVLLRLQQATALGPDPSIREHLIYTDDVDTFNLPSNPMTPIQKRIHTLIMHLDVPLFDEASRLSLMEMYAHQRNWAEFWDIWRLAPRHGKPRSAEFYASMFVLVAASHHIKGVQTVLRHWTPEMAIENPPVGLTGNVALAIDYCLRVADPQVEEEFAADPDSPAEWVRLRKKLDIANGI